MNELIMPHNIGVKNALENMKEVLALYKKVIGNYRPLLDGERYLTDKEVTQILKVSRQRYRNTAMMVCDLNIIRRQGAFGLRIRNLTPSPFLPNLLFDPN